VPPETDPWLYYAAKAGGGIVISVCVHKLDLFRFLFREVSRFSAMFEIDESRSSAQRPCEWSAAVTLQFESGAIGNVFTFYHGYTDKWEPETLELYATDGAVRASGWDGFEVISKRLPEWAQRFIAYEPDALSAWAQQLAAFHDSIVHDAPNSADGRDPVATMALLDAIYESGGRQGEPVEPVRYDV
jgi:predicted dehydrogenase